MDIERINSVLNRAILGFQESEIEAMVEAAMAGGYAVPTPTQLGFGYKPKPPSAFGFEPKKKGIVGGAEELEDRIEFTKAFLKKLKQFKKDVPGIASMRQGYKGSGGQKDNVQINIRFKGEPLMTPSFSVFVRPSEFHVLERLHNTQFHIDTDGLTVDEAYKKLLDKIAKELKGMGYEAPSKAKGKKKSGWKKGEFGVDDGGIRRSVSGVIKGIWGVYKETMGSRRWVIVHIPSMVQPFEEMSTKKMATKVVDFMEKNEPGLFSEKKLARIKGLGSALVLISRMARKA